mmetsp:Transcript_13965/g.21767  ORF Transcript_13965/g.21767 Transcript_13965/m.21767 type:complete len:86 (-) Transcript_13965:314-571(-)
MVKGSVGHRDGLTLSERMFTVKEFKYHYMDQYDFLEKAQTGDLLLFRGTHIAGKLQRAFSNGPIDHVAMIIKSEHANSVLFLEST